MQGRGSCLFSSKFNFMEYDLTVKDTGLLVVKGQHRSFSVLPYCFRIVFIT